MKLRRQLALVSLVALVLPWTLLQYLDVFNALIKDGQVRALKATAVAVAARLGAEPELLPNRVTDPEQTLYAHTLPAPPLIDGFADDWQSYNLGARHFSGTDGFAFEIRVGHYHQALSVVLEVRDTAISYHRPGGLGLASADHLVVAADNRYFVIRADAPGQTQTLYRNLAGDIQRDYRIAGAWRETADGYRVELQLPLFMAREHFGIAVIDSHHAQQLGTLSDLALLVAGPDPGVLPTTQARLVTSDPAVARALEVFNRPGLQLTVTDAGLWELAGTTVGPTLPTQKQIRARDNRLSTWLMQHLNSRERLPSYERQTRGRHESPETRGALAGTPTHGWFRADNAEIAVLAVPIYRESAGSVESKLAGVVIAEELSAPGQGVDANRLGQLFLITLAGGLVLLLTLLGYASWLSWRIRRLSFAAREARELQQPAGLLRHWPQSPVRDELSDLADSYQALLLRIQSYTDYLKSLSGKLSHELRTPLAVVRSSLDNLSGTCADEEALTYTRRAREGTERLGAILTAMTEASRVEASIQQAETETVDLAALLTDIAAAYSDTYRRPVRCVLPGPATDWHTQVAPELLVQMLDKLIDNANDFSPPGKPVDITLTELKPRNELRQGRIVISNQGPLLPAELAGQLFDSLTSARPGRGSDDKIHLGLGLFIAALIAAYHGGKITARNRPDQTGVEMIIDMPLPAPGIYAQAPNQSTAVDKPA